MKKLIVISMLLVCFLYSAQAQWSSNPLENLQLSDLPGEQAIPKVAVGPGGDFYVAFFSLESGNYNVRLQRLDKDGNLLWDENGLLVSNHPSMSWLTDWDIAVDHNNHAILTWQDIRSNGNNNVVAYRITPEGSFFWGENGIMLSDNDNFDVAPVVAVTTANNSVFAWQSEGNIIMQKISPMGSKLWGDHGITLSSANSYTWPQLMPVGNDDIIMKFYEDIGPFWAPDRHLLAQRFDVNGSAVWPQHTVISDDGNITAWTQIISMIPDRNQGFYISWHDYSISGLIASARLQHVNAAGQPQFPGNGVMLSANHGNHQFYPQVAKPQNDPGIYVYWEETNGDQNLFGIYGQKVSADGSLMWGENGKIIIPLGTQSVTIEDIDDTGDDVMLFLSRPTGGTHRLLQSMRLNNKGEFVWAEEQKPVSTAAGTKGHVDLSAFSNGQWVLTWSDNRTGAVNIFAQNLQPDGTLGVVDDSGQFTISFNVVNDSGEAITNAIITLNGMENEEGSYIFGDMAPGVYNYQVTAFCYQTVTGELTVSNAPVEMEVIMPNLMGDANGDGTVNVLDVIATISYFINSGPEEFCFYNADVNQDGVINVLDTIEIVNIFLN